MQEFKFRAATFVLQVNKKYKHLMLDRRQLSVICRALIRADGAFQVLSAINIFTRKCIKMLQLVGSTFYYLPTTGCARQMYRSISVLFLRTGVSCWLRTGNMQQRNGTVVLRLFRNHMCLYYSLNCHVSM